MAASKVILEQVNSITECSVCVEMMVDPKMLPCMHTFCFKCLHQYWKEKQPGDKVSCPLCRELFEIPHGGLMKLQSNFVVQQLIDAQKLSTKDEFPKCDICSCQQIDMLSSTFCVDCQQNLCSQCSKEHLLKNISHKIEFSKDEPELESLLAFSGDELCEQHKGKKLKIYCTDCKVVVCTACFLGKHKKHDGSDITEVLEELKKQIREGVCKISRQALELSGKLFNLDKYVEHFLETTKGTEKQILERRVELKHIIDSQVDELLKRLRQEKTNTLHRFENARDELKCQKTILDKYESEAEEVLSKGTPAYVAKVIGELNSRVENLENISIIHSENCCFEATFLPSNLRIQSTEEGNLIGTIDVIKKPYQNVTSTKPLSNARGLQLINTIQLGSEVRGISIVGYEVFVVCANSNEVHVYDINTVEFKIKFVVKGLSKPWSLVANNNALFISESHMGVIHRVELPMKTTTKWSVGGSNCGLSITKQGNILVSQEDRICEYTEDGSLKRKLIMRPEMREVNHAIRLDTDRLLLAHANIKMHRVCLIDADGKLIKSYGGTPGVGTKQMYHPAQLVVDRSENILVPCYGDKRVLLLNSQLKFVKAIIPSSDNISCISTICLDEVRGQLLVADSNEKSISVFKFN